MSASQTPSPGRTPNGAPPQSLFRRKQADPLVRRKKPAQARPTPRTSTPSNINGVPGQSAATGAQPPANQQKQVPQEEYEDIPVFTTKRALLDGVRHHVMRLLPNNSFENKQVDPTDETQFVRPVRLHRRDPRASSNMQWRESSAPSSDGESKFNAMDDKERERMEAAKAEKRAEREANQAQIAPTAKKIAENKKKNKLQKKTELVYKFSDSATKEKNQRIRYEEALPWHLEDFENKNTWAGSYEAALSECHVMLVRDPSSNAFRMVPVEKWYKFTPKNQFKTLSIEEAEARMGKKIRDPRWFMETQKETERSQREQVQRYGRGSLFTRQGERGERPKKGTDDDFEKPEEVADEDDIDYDYEEAFADDEENALFEGDKEESKQAEQKLMRERREANVFELKEEKDYDEEEEEEKRRAEEEKKLAKKIEKALMKRERNFVYEDDSDRNPYESESESQDSDEEASNEEGATKDQEGGDTNDKLKAASNDKFASGASSKGTNTPSGRSKGDDPKRGLLKRPASPNQSEASGNESSRKKVKKSHASSQPGSSGLAGPSISRPNSPANGDIRKNPIKLNMRAGSGAGSGSDAEMSDGTKSKNKKVKLNSVANSRAASPNGSRAGSPAASGAQADGQSTTKPQQVDNEPPPPLPTPEDVRSHIPPEGVELATLMKIYGRKVVKNPQFVPLVKSQGRWVKEEKKFYPKGS